MIPQKMGAVKNSLSSVCSYSEDGTEHNSSDVNSKDEKSEDDDESKNSRSWAGSRASKVSKTSNVSRGSRNSRSPTLAKFSIKGNMNSVNFKAKFIFHRAGDKEKSKSRSRWGSARNKKKKKWKNSNNSKNSRKSKASRVSWVPSNINLPNL